MPRWFRRGYQKWAKRQLEKRRYLDFLAARPPQAYPPDYSDLWFLYTTVRRRKPGCVLEFGSGCSTVILAQALWDNDQESSTRRPGHLYSVDADPYWAETAMRSLPNHLRSVCSVSHSSLLEIECFGTPAFRHAQVPDVAPDLLYLDGPDLTPRIRVAVDVLDMEERFQPGFCLIVDGRKENTAFLLRHLKKKYRYKYRRQFRNSVFTFVS